MKYNHIEFYEIVYNKKYLNNVNNNRTCNLINKLFVGLVNYFNIFFLITTRNSILTYTDYNTYLK
jgi:hypothetical protein